jgi:solute:Na+ symporter, SSS family
MALRPLDLLVVFVYMASLSLIGVWFSRKQTTREEYHLGGRSVHWVLAAGSILVTLFSTLTMLGAPGEMVRYGFAYYASALGALAAAPAITHWVIPMLRSLPVASIYGYLGKRFSIEVRKLAAGVYVARTLVWMALIIYSCSLAVSEVTGWSMTATLIITGLSTTFYSSIGGLKSVVWTDNLQLWVLLGGMLAIPMTVASALGTGPVAWWDSFSQAGRTQIIPFSFDPTVRMTLFGMMMGQFFWTVCANASDQSAAQRYLATPTAADARRTVWFYSLLHLILFILLALCGLSLFAFYLAKSGQPVAQFQVEVARRADRLMPMYIARELPPGVAGLVLAGLLAAAMSSLSSGINSISSVVANDFLPKNTLRADKWVAAGAGLAGVVLALLLTWSIRNTTWNLFEMTSRLNNMLVGPMAVLFFTGILVKRARTQTVLVAFAASVTVAVAISFSKVSFTWLVPASFTIGLLVARLLSSLAGGSTIIEEYGDVGITDSAAAGSGGTGS